VERDWREVVDLRSCAVLGAVIAAAGALRFWALGHGLPFIVGIDEPQIMSRVTRMMATGDFNPRFFDYPGLYLYVQLGVACARFLAGAAGGAWHSLAQTTASDFYLWGRAVTALLGTITVYLVYLIGKRWSTRHGLLAAGLMAVMPNHVRESHYVLTDVPMTFFVALSFLLTLRALEKRTLGAFAWAGAVAGLAAATKYYGGVVLAAPLAAAFMTTGTERSRTTLALSVAGAAMVAFLLGAPYTILDLPGFLAGFAGLATAFQGSAPPEPAWLTYLKHVRNAMWWPGALLLAWGAVHAIRAITGPGRDRFTLVVLFTGLYFALVGTRTLVFARYLMPLFPFISLLVAIAILSGMGVLRRLEVPAAARTALVVALALVAIVPPLRTCLSNDRSISRRSTAHAAFEWLNGNVPAGSRVIVEAYGFDAISGHCRLASVRRLIDHPQDFYTAGQADYVVAAADIFGPYLRSPEAYPNESAAYQRLFGDMALVRTITQSADLVGPEMRIYKVTRPAANVPEAAAGVERGAPGGDHAD
jgi:4-amino-4-deoxy-L-arabinose transferase-like glycosyltransferase